MSELKFDLEGPFQELTSRAQAQASERGQVIHLRIENITPPITSESPNDQRVTANVTATVVLPGYSAYTTPIFRAA